MVRDYFDFQKSRAQAEEGRERVKERVSRHRGERRNATRNGVTATPGTASTSGDVTLQSAVSRDEGQDLGLDLDLHAAHARAREAIPTPDGQDREERESLTAGTPIAETELRTIIAALPGADRRTLDVVEPLANQVTSETFHEILDDVRRSNAKNPIGLLVHALRTAITAAAHDAHERGLAALPAHDPEPVERLPADQALELHVRRLTENGHPWPAIRETLTLAFGDDLDLERAHAIHQDALDPEPEILQA